MLLKPCNVLTFQLSKILFIYIELYFKKKQKSLIWLLKSCHKNPYVLIKFVLLKKRVDADTLKIESFLSDYISLI